MNLHDEAWKMALDEHKRHCVALDGELKLAHSLKSPRLLRSTTIAALRLQHIAKLTLTAYWNAKPAKVAIGLPKTLSEIIRHKNTPTLLAIYHFTHAQHIPLEYWFRAQLDILRKMPQVWISCFYGQKAFERYTDWDKRLRRKYTRTDDRVKHIIPDSLKRQITKAILAGHQTALTWQTVLQSLQPPSLSAALAYISQSVPVWYLIAHEDFQRDVLETGLIESPALTAAWEQYKKSPWPRKFCKEAMDVAVSRYGTLELRK